MRINTSKAMEWDEKSDEDREQPMKRKWHTLLPSQLYECFYI